jgi:hypothetical protein
MKDNTFYTVWKHVHSQFEFTIAFYLNLDLTTKLYANIYTVLMTVYEIQDQLSLGWVHEECIKSSIAQSV